MCEYECLNMLYMPSELTPFMQGRWSKLSTFYSLAPYCYVGWMTYLIVMNSILAGSNGGSLDGLCQVGWASTWLAGPMPGWLALCLAGWACISLARHLPGWIGPLPHWLATAWLASFCLIG